MPPVNLGKPDKTQRTPANPANPANPGKPGKPAKNRGKYRQFAYTRLRIVLNGTNRNDRISHTLLFTLYMLYIYKIYFLFNIVIVYCNIYNHIYNIIYIYILNKYYIYIWVILLCASKNRMCECLHMWKTVKGNQTLRSQIEVKNWAQHRAV